MAMMKAAVMYAPGGPEVLKIENRSVPEVQPGQVLIRVRAFGLNRSEMFTRQGYSPEVHLPRILGIEAVGLVEEAPGGEFVKGQPDPARVVMAFLQGTYSAAADLAQWDRASLDRDDEVSRAALGDGPHHGRK